MLCVRGEEGVEDLKFECMSNTATTFPKTSWDYYETMT